METICEEEFNILDIIKKNARYQKVMLLYDNTVGEDFLLNIYSQIKGECVFNRCHLKDLDASELNNGYRLLIFVCCADSFIASNVDTSNFINVFLPTDNTILPFYVGSGKTNENNSYLITNKNTFDFGVLPSVLFNKVYNHLYNLYYTQCSDENFDFDLTNITQKFALEKLDSLTKNTQFVDVELIKKMKLDYKFLPVVDYLLTTGLLCFVSSAKDRNLSMVDLYKVIKDDDALIEKYYALTCDGFMLNLVTLNYNNLSFLMDKTRNLILQVLPNELPSNQELQTVLLGIEKFCCYGDTLLNYLFLFNCFE